VEEDIPCEVRTIVPLLGELQRARIDNEYFSKVTETARNANEFHLSIDDIDKFKGTDFKDQELGELFDLIYRRNLRLTVTSNLALEGLVESDRVLSSIVRRIDEICIALPF
jgi:hypothetical protein